MCMPFSLYLNRIECMIALHSSSVFLFAHHSLDFALLIILQRHDFQRAQVSDVVRGNTIVMEQVPLSLVLHDTMVGCPTNNRFKNDALIGEWAVRIVAYGVAQQVAVAS